MADSKGATKPTFISISSSEEEDEDNGDDDYEDNSLSFSSSSSSCSEDETEEEEEEEEDEEDGKESDDGDRIENDESLYSRLIALLEGEGELESLSLMHFRAYLRKHGLLITGTKAVCQQRILEHWKIKDGNAEALYPSSSFYINCTGDVCKGDVVLFKQKVYEKFNALRRHGRILGRRTIAGRVAKESYGKAKQQHTFTVEVLWSKGVKKLPPLFPLLVKGRNLYKLKTYRQRWNDEAERRNVLAEKHRRGKAARLMKRMREMKKKSTKDVGIKHQKYSNHSEPMRKRKAFENQKQIRHSGATKKRKNSEQEKGKIANTERKAFSPRRANMRNNCQATSLVRQMDKKRNCRLRASNSSDKRHQPVHITDSIDRSLHSYACPVLNPYQAQRRFQQQNDRLQLARDDMGSTSTSTMERSLCFRPYAHSNSRFLHEGI